MNEIKDYNGTVLHTVNAGSLSGADLSGANLNGANLVELGLVSSEGGDLPSGS